MQVTGENDTDICLDKNGQPLAKLNGESILVLNDECWLQDLKNEILTEEGELFYEDESGDDSYGYGVLDYMQREYDEFTEMEIEQRIFAKLEKREYIDAATVSCDVDFADGIYNIKVSFNKKDESKEYNIDIETNGIEVIIE